MRWHDLFADLEGQAQAWEQADRDAEIADRSRAELATVELVDRLAASVDEPVALRVSGAGEVRGRLETLGFDWLLLHEETGAEALVLTAAVALVSDLGRRSRAGSTRSPVLARLGVVSPLRAIARDRSAVRIWLRDGSGLTGTPDRVGSDHVDLVVHDLDEPARSEGRAHVTVPFAMLALARTVASPWA